MQAGRSSRSLGLSLEQIRTQQEEWRRMQRGQELKPTIKSIHRKAMLDLVRFYNLKRESQGTRQGPALATDDLLLSQHRRDKRLMMHKSCIHNFGLFSCEMIAPGDFVVEYVGERIRSSMADIREQRYRQMGLSSTYLFKASDYEVIDATMKGNLARFINHSCEPNCRAVVHRVSAPAASPASPGTAAGNSP
eukprot:RCo048587